MNQLEFSTTYDYIMRRMLPLPVSLVGLGCSEMLLLGWVLLDAGRLLSAPFRPFPLSPPGLFFGIVRTMTSEVILLLDMQL